MFNMFNINIINISIIIIFISIIITNVISTSISIIISSSSSLSGSSPGLLHGHEVREHDAGHAVFGRLPAPDHMLDYFIL